MCSGLPTLVLGDVSAPVLHDLTSASLPDPVSLGSPSSVGELVLSSHTPKETSAIPEVVSLAPAWGYRDLFSWWKQEQGVVRFMWELMMQGVGSDCGDSKTHFFFWLVLKRHQSSPWNRVYAVRTTDVSLLCRVDPLTLQVPPLWMPQWL